MVLEQYLADQAFIGGMNEGDFNHADVKCTQLFIPVSRIGSLKSHTVRLWLNIPQSNPPTDNIWTTRGLILMEDFPLSDDARWELGATLYTSLLLFAHGLKEAGYTMPDANLSNVRETMQAESEFVNDPVAFLENLGAHVGTGRIIHTLFRVRKALDQVPSTYSMQKSGADWIIGYPIYIAAL
ncbi:hypothetical protein ACFL6R_07705 [Gemmatimonadota bacterium]